MNRSSYWPLLVIALLCGAASIAPSASAKVCSGIGTGLTCSGTHGKVYSNELKSEGSLTLTSSFMVVTCLSRLDGSVTNGETGAAKVTNLGLSACNALGFEDCLGSSTASTTTPWAATFTTGAAPNGNLTIEPVSVQFSCFIEPTMFFVVCKYAIAKAGGSGEITVAGGGPAQITLTKVPVSKQTGSSTLCSATATLSGKFTIGTPNTLYLT